MKSKLTFNKCTGNWEEYLPLGNGRLGVMQKSHPVVETLQLNEEGIWSGGPTDRINPSTKKYLPQLRKLIKDGKIREAQELAFETMSGTSFAQRVYQTAGNFNIDFFSENNYGIQGPLPPHDTPQVCLDTLKTELDLEQAVATVSYTDDLGVTFTRTTWVSAIDDLIFLHICASKPGSINFRGHFDRGIWVDKIYSEDDFIFLNDSHGIPFTAGAGAITKGGNFSVKGSCLVAQACDEALIFIDINSFQWDLAKDTDISARKYELLKRRDLWSAAVKTKLQSVKKLSQFMPVSDLAEYYLCRHTKEYKNYFDRFKLELGSTQNKENAPELPTPELLKSAEKSNVELVKLYADFSRYLLISGSRRPGKLPLTLQGLWNGYMDPPWGSKYTININAQMNYWPVNLCSLSDCEIPLFDLLERGYIQGRKVAKKMYGCRGFVMHHNTDYWGDAVPQDCWMPGTYWVLGAAWIATHIWEHYEYTQDKASLFRYYYLMREAALFFVDFLTPSDQKAEDGEPYLVVNPSVSPENSYITKAGQTGAFTPGCQMDNMILEHLFTGCLKAMSVIGVEDKKMIKDFEYVLNHLKKPELNKDGSLMEWNEEVQEVEKGHRHISHLYGLFPGITIKKDDEKLMKAAEKTLQNRLENGGGHTGWSLAWIINFYTQLGLGDKALENLVKLFHHSTLPNLLDNHPPFQIDGNFGTLAGIVRMFVQSNFDEDGNVIVNLLPAIPSDPAYSSGKISGVQIKGDYRLSFEWKDFKVVDVKLTPGSNAIDKDKVIIR
ncbi:MAG: glycoside hydrolase family 95 protein [Treponema sp.]|nr:glycoside hydrolase family 95 protein [Treponema sp.]